MKPTYEELEAQAKQLKIDADCYKKGMEASNARLVQLAAENAGLNKFIAESCFVQAGEVPSWHHAIDHAPETPATDAFLAEVRASAVDEACLKISNAIVNCYQDEQIGLDAAATICGDFAAQLRKGVQS
ncbi:hypothetical protein [Citrobacter farmeri]|uniref:hypothetical protein n=1 Tax=Citrobacter farmeri TaxID=67824 RepID=UPI003899A0E8